MKIGVRAISEVREGEVCRRSVRHDYGIRIDVGIAVDRDLAKHRTDRDQRKGEFTIDGAGACERRRLELGACERRGLVMLLPLALSLSLSLSLSGIHLK